MAGVVEADLARGHGGGFVQVGEWGVDYCDVGFFVACGGGCQWSGLVLLVRGLQGEDAPSIEFALVSCPHSSTSAAGSASHSHRCCPDCDSDCDCDGEGARRR